MHTKAPEQQLAMRYAQIADDRNFEAMREIIAEDFYQKGPEWECTNADAFIAQLQILKDNFTATFHMVGNQIGEWENDRYQGETYTVASHLYEVEGVGRKLDMAIRYRETIEKVNGEYRYTRRDVNIVWTSDQPLNS